MPIDHQSRTAFLLAFAFALPIMQANGATAAFPLRVSADRHYLEDSDGKPFLLVGDTAWSLLAQLGEDNIRRYLDDRAQRGFNSIIVNLIEHKFASHAPAKLDGTQPFLKPGDFAQPNPAYFDFAHRAVEQAQRRGISVWLFPRISAGRAAMKASLRKLRRRVRRRCGSTDALSANISRICRTSSG